MTKNPNDLTGLRVLLVEDNLLIADLLAATVRSHGVVVVGAAPDLEAGLQYAHEVEFDGAVLGIKLCGDFCFPIAAALTERKIPFLFLTGYGDPGLIPPEYRAVRQLTKPIDPDGLCAAIAQEFRGTRHRCAAVR